jgi:hypothetical protein
MGDIYFYRDIMGLEIKPDLLNGGIEDARVSLLWEGYGEKENAFYPIEDVLNGFQGALGRFWNNYKRVREGRRRIFKPDAFFESDDTKEPLILNKKDALKFLSQREKVVELKKQRVALLQASENITGSYDDFNNTLELEDTDSSEDSNLNTIRKQKRRGKKKYCFSEICFRRSRRIQATKSGILYRPECMHTCHLECRGHMCNLCRR